MLRQPDATDVPVVDLGPLVTELVAIRERLNALAPVGPLDHEALMSRGYSEREAYALLRRHGVRLPGAKRSRIAVSVLEAIERGELPA